MTTTNQEVHDALLKQVGELTDDISDEELRHLVIHYATWIRSNNNEESRLKYIDHWNNVVPPAISKRFFKLVLDGVGKDPFWDKPAKLNLKYGIK